MTKRQVFNDQNGIDRQRDQNFRPCFQRAEENGGDQIKQQQDRQKPQRFYHRREKYVQTGRRHQKQLQVSAEVFERDEDHRRCGNQIQRIYRNESVLDIRPCVGKPLDVSFGGKSGGHIEEYREDPAGKST